MQDHTLSRFRVAPFLLAAGASAALVLAAPFLGEIRRAILLRFPGQFVRIIGTVVALALLAATAAALVRIRERRVPRYAAIAVALAIGGSYAWLTRTGDPQVDAVERFHFVEYGLVTFLFYRAWRPAADRSVLVLPILAGLLVGTIEEWFQWFIPARVGDIRDIFLNGVAIACGLIFSAALDPPARVTTTLTAASWRRIGAFGALLVLAVGLFVHSVHLGHVIDGDGWSFRSNHSRARLEAAAAERAARWRGTTVRRPERLSAEDQYMTEGHWHVARRNEAWAQSDVVTAWNENLILERYFAPVLDTPSYVSGTGHRWSGGHRADAARRLAGSPGGHYESQAHPAPIYAWSRPVYWGAVILIAALLAAPWVAGTFVGRRAAKATASGQAARTANRPEAG